MAANQVNAPRSAHLSADGQTLLFRSHEEASPPMTTKGIRELYRYRAGQDIACVSCGPRGEAPAATLAGLDPALGPARLSARRRPPTTSRRTGSGSSSRPPRRSRPKTPTAREAASRWARPAEVPRLPRRLRVGGPEEGSCKAGGPSYSPLNEGCLYLISTGKSNWPSLFGDASSERRRRLLLHPPGPGRPRQRRTARRL